MARISQNFASKLEKLEEEKESLLKKRRQEIIQLIEKTGALGIDDDLLAGMLLFFKKKAEEKNNPGILSKEIEDWLAKIQEEGNIFFRANTRSKNQKKPNTEQAK